jgi:hypothetical protein
MKTKTAMPVAKPVTADLFVCWGEEIQPFLSRREAKVYARFRGGPITITKQRVQLNPPRRKSV